MIKINKRILIIEDEKTLARALQLKLQRGGFEVQIVFNGEDGLKLLQAESFDLILLDLIMPKMDGFMVLSNLKKKKIKTPVLILSNLSQENDIKRTRSFGVKEFFIKSNTRLSSILSRVINILK